MGKQVGHGQTRQLIEELREATRQANGVRNDLDRMLRESRAEMGQAIDHRIEEPVNAHIRELNTATNKNIARIERQVREYFTSLVSALLAEMLRNTRESRETILANLTKASAGPEAAELFEIVITASNLESMAKHVRKEPPVTWKRT